jgi:hypothetical protein
VLHLIMAHLGILDGLGGIGVVVAEQLFATVHNDHHHGDHVQADSKD